ncbi:class I SAM-dependent methyltransferase [Mycobacterium seoulense]|uniref:class I SAM-dependent methyltransferase n=1 Tax=Mycobacterium seoulense TaxID=386911 RepID=UPI003CEAA930
MSNGMSQLCPICGGPGAMQAHGRIAPFILQLRGNAENLPRDTTLRICDSCDLVYFSHRFDNDTLAAIYSDYHNDRYLSIRRRWEPWYSRNVHNAMEPGSAAVAERIDFVTKVVEPYVKIGSLRNIVDYGGDEGQFFPPSYLGPKYVIDVSGKDVVEGVRTASSLGELPDRPHLVTACGVLEHLIDPVATVKQIRAAIADDGFFYAEVPLDRPKVRRWHAGASYSCFLDWVSATRGGWIAADFVTGVARNFGRKVPRLGAVKQSEHINYFSPQSLERLLVEGGFRVVSTQADPKMSYGGMRLGRLGALAVPR